MQLDHLNLYTADVLKSRAMYEPLMTAFGHPVVRDFDEVAVGFGHENYAVLALVRTKLPIEPTHVAFRVDHREDVKRFHKMALELGFSDEGEPGLRPHYHEHYYAAFVRDLDGHNLEMVCHLPPEQVA